MCIYYSFRTSLMHTHSHKYTITCDEIEEFSVESLNNKRGTYNVQRTTPTSTQLTVHTRREKKLHDHRHAIPEEDYTFIHTEERL